MGGSCPDRRLLVSWFPSGRRLTPPWSASGGLSFARRPLRRLGVRLDADPVVDGASQLLLAPEISLGGLDRDVTEQKLDLIQFAAG